MLSVHAANKNEVSQVLRQVKQLLASDARGPACFRKLLVRTPVRWNHWLSDVVGGTASELALAFAWQPISRKQQNASFGRSLARLAQAQHLPNQGKVSQMPPKIQHRAHLMQTDYYSLSGKHLRKSPRKPALGFAFALALAFASMFGQLAV